MRYLKPAALFFVVLFVGYFSYKILTQLPARNFEDAQAFIQSLDRQQKSLIIDQGKFSELMQSDAWGLLSPYAASGNWAAEFTSAEADLAKAEKIKTDVVDRILERDHEDEVAELVNKIFGTRMGPEQLQRCMDDMDPDGSGEVDFGEFATWCNREVPLDRLDDIYGWRLVQHQALAGSGGKLQYAMSRLLRMWFNEADTDGGGSLEGKEVAKLASVLLGRELNVYETERLMEQMDPVVRCEVCDGGRVAHVKCKNCGGKGKTGGDGEVDFLEFEVRQQLLSVAAVAACLLACSCCYTHSAHSMHSGAC